MDNMGRLPLTAELKRDYWFEYERSIPYEPGICPASLVVCGGKLLIADRGIEREGFFPRGRILSVDLLDGAEAVAVEGIQTRFLLPFCPLNAGGDILVSDNSRDGKISLNVYSGRSGARGQFSPCDLRSEYNHNFMKRVDDAVFISFFESHLVRKYSLDGRLLQEFETWKNHEFPRCLERYSDDEILISFDNALYSPSQQMKFSRGLQTTHASVVLWNHISNQFAEFPSALNSVSIHSIARVPSGIFWGVDHAGRDQRIVKTDHHGRVLFDRFFMDFVRLQSMSWPQPTGNVSMAADAERLFVTTTPFGNFNRILVFRILQA